VINARENGSLEVAEVGMAMSHPQQLAAFASISSISSMIINVYQS